MFNGSSGTPTAVPDGPHLIERTACGDETALGQLYDIFSADVFGVAVRILRDSSLAEDATQETFVAVWRNAAYFRPDLASARTWITAIARHRSIDMLRRRGSRPIEVSLDGVTGPLGTDVWTEVARRLDREAMVAILARLPETQRRAIELAYVRGLTHVEIAMETGAPLGTVKSRVRLGLVGLRKMVHENAAPPGAAETARNIRTTAARSARAASPAMSLSNFEPRSTLRPVVWPLAPLA